MTDARRLNVAITRGRSAHFYILDQHAIDTGKFEDPSEAEKGDPDVDDDPDNQELGLQEENENLSKLQELNKFLRKEPFTKILWTSKRPSMIKHAIIVKEKATCLTTARILPSLASREVPRRSATIVFLPKM